MTNIIIQAYDSGIVVSKAGLNDGFKDGVFELKNLDKALLAIYRLCNPHWKVGDTIQIVSEDLNEL